MASVLACIAVLSAAASFSCSAFSIIFLACSTRRRCLALLDLLWALTRSLCSCAGGVGRGQARRCSNLCAVPSLALACRSSRCAPPGAGSGQAYLAGAQALADHLRLDLGAVLPAPLPTVELAVLAPYTMFRMRKSAAALRGVPDAAGRPSFVSMPPPHSTRRSPPVMLLHTASAKYKQQSRINYYA